jgi:hypothetical protein
LLQVSRLDIVFDVYIESSLKQATRLKRGSAGRVRVFSNSPIPKNWENFLFNSENKTELFTLLANTVLKIPVGEKILIATCGSDVISQIHSR